MAKKRFYYDTRYVDNTVDINGVRLDLINNYRNKYFNLFMTIFKIKNASVQEDDFIKRRYWDTGLICSFNTDIKKVYFSTFAGAEIDVYDWPKIVNVVNKRGAWFFPEGPQLVDVDVAIGYIKPNHKPIREMVDHYVTRIVNIDMVINTNLILHKIPFAVAVTPQDMNKARDIIQRIMNDDPVVFMELKDLQLVKALTTSAPYIIDKLYSQRISLENELLTELGIDNVIADQARKERLLVDEVNANNALINLNGKMMQNNIEDFLKQTNALFGTNFELELMIKPVQSIYEEEGNPGRSEDDESVQ